MAKFEKGLNFPGRSVLLSEKMERYLIYGQQLKKERREASAYVNWATNPGMTDLFKGVEIFYLS